MGQPATQQCNMGLERRNDPAAVADVHWLQEEVLRVAQQQHAGLGSSDAGGADAARGSKENLPQKQVRGLLDAVLAA